MTNNRRLGDAAIEPALYRPPPAAFRDRVEAAQIAATLAGAPAATLVPLVCAGVLAAGFWSSPQRDLLLHLLALVAATAGLSMLALRKAAGQPPGTLRRAAGAIAFLVGAAFGAMSLVAILSADASQFPVTLATLSVALAGVALCGPLAGVGACLSAPVAVAAATGFAVRGGPEAALAPLLLLVVAALGIELRRREQASASAIVDRLRAAEQAETITTLLLDQDAGAQGWVWDTDAAGRLCDAAPALAASLGRDAGSLDGTLFMTVLVPPAQKHAESEGARAIRSAMADRKPFRDLVVEVQSPRGAVWWRLSGKPLADGAGGFAGYRGIGADITEARDTEARIAYLADYDPLTGLANREHFHARAGLDCEASARDGQRRALLYLDLDGFKSINDGLGHAAGDKALQEAARRLTAIAPEEALVARLGGDEFAVWHASTPARAEALATRLIEALAAPFDIDGAIVSLAACVGIAYAPRHAASPDALLGKADLALYRAKAQGGGLFRVFEEADERAIVDKRRLCSDLELALARGELELHYQPLVDLARGDVLAFEALIRWHSPTRGSVAPVDFIPAAEASGLITAIGSWVLRQACRDAASWPHRIRVAVNVSPKQFVEAGFLGSVAAALQASGLSPSRLEIEVTEGVFLDQSARTLAHLTSLRESGIRIALDDFGTGYSSLSYLTNFPVDKIKIDRSFVQELARRENQAIVEAILTLARRLSIEVTAEGVETAEQALALRVRRCDVIQGYLVGKPRPAADVPAMIAEAPAALQKVMPLGNESPLALALAMRRKSAVVR